MHLPGRLITKETVRLHVCVAQDSAQLEELISLAKKGASVMVTVLAPLNIGPPDGEGIIWKAVPTRLD